MKHIILALVAGIMSSSFAFAANDKNETRYAVIVVRDLDIDQYIGPADDGAIFQVEVASQPIPAVGSQKQKYCMNIRYTDKNSKFGSSGVSVGDFSLVDAIALRDQVLNPNNHIELHCHGRSECKLKSINMSNRR